MGLLYREIEKQAEELHAEKTIGPAAPSESDSAENKKDSDLA